MKLFFVSLGCDKNLVDSEVMLGNLSEKGYSVTDDETDADVIVVNTCCFINDAKEESIETILEMAKLKQVGNLKALLVTGCLAQRYQDEIKKEIPEVDAILGTSAIDMIVQAVEDALSGNGHDYINALNLPAHSGTKRMVTTGGHFAYLKIAEGCDKHCSYCIIPKIRGNYRSVAMEELIAEAQKLVSDGVKELILVAQETTLYGMDLYKEKKLPELLEKLCDIEDLKWIRILYCYPEEITPELVAVIKNEEKICHYLDVPIQHASDKILKRMGRRTNREQLIQKIAMLRTEVPDICLRTTLITGFPGETQEDHEILMDFVNEMEFDRLGVFTYSPEENTPAAEMKDQIDDEIKIARQSEIMELQQEIAFENADKMIGRTLEVMVEGKVADEDVYIARTYKDAPNVDGFLFFESEYSLMSGDYCKVRVTGTNEYDLLGEMIQE